MDSRVFQRDQDIQKYIKDNKTYREACTLHFVSEDYRNCVIDTQFDLLVSQYAGNVGQDLKHMLRIGGILLVAEGPTDAALAFSDNDYLYRGTIGEKDGQCVLLPEAPFPCPVCFDPSTAIFILQTSLNINPNFCFKRIR